MLPTLESGEGLLVNKAVYWFRRPQRGDIVVFDDPKFSETLIKRVVAVGGETIETKPDTTGQTGLDHDCGDCGVYVNGVRLNEPYVKETTDYGFPLAVVPPGDVFVLGDNRRNSSDSHVWGPLPVDRIRGKVLFR